MFQGTLGELSLAFYGEVASGAEVEPVPLPDASRLCPVFRPRALPSTYVCSAARVSAVNHFFYC